MFKFLRDLHRAKVRERPFPPEHLAIIEERLAYWRLLSEEDRKELLGHVAVFLDEKHFEGAGGLELTDEVRVTIAAQACVLLLHRDTDYYPGLVSIIVYPAAYLAETRRGGVVIDQGRLGESHAFDRVVLAWDAARVGAANVQDARNVVLHEFAHQLDYEDGLYDGTPALPSRSAIRTWARVLGQDYEHLLAEGDDVLDAYGAESSAEFFAVATEAFFEKPAQMKARHPELYAQLVEYYAQDPAARVE